MKFGSLFSGIEAASAAWLPLGWACAWVAEIDPFACAVLAHHYPDTPNLGDITRVDWNATEPVDLVVGGPPCQDFSVAGRRAGLDGERGDLSLAYVDALDAIDPLWSLTENVPGWLSMGDNAFGHFLARLVGHDAPLVPRRGQRWTDAGMAAGPKRTAAWRICDAQYFGVPQRRRRVFVVACRGAGNWACADALFPVREGVQRDFAPRREAGERVAPSLTVGAHGSSGHQYRQKGNEDALIAKCLEGHPGRRDYETETFVAATAPPCTSNPYGDHESREGLLIAFSAKDHGADAGDTAPTLRAGGHDRSHANAGVMPAVLAFDPRQIHHPANHSNPKPGDPCHPLRGVANCEPAIIAHALRADGFDASEDGTGRGTPLIAVDWSNSAGGPNSEDTFMTLGQRHPAVMTAVPLLEIGKRTNGDGYRDGDGIGRNGDPMYSLQAGAQHGVMTAMPIKNALASGGNGATRNSINGADNDPMWTLDQRSQHAVMTLAIHGRGDSHDLEYRDDGIANAVLTPNGGRAGIGVGAVAFDTTQITSPGNVSSPKPGDPCHPLASAAHPPAVMLDLTARQPEWSLDRAMKTDGPPAVASGISVRRLTPGECLKLQGFPPDYLDIQYRGKPAADGPKYRATGNSMAVPCIKWLGRRIQQFTEQEATNAE